MALHNWARVLIVILAGHPVIKGGVISCTVTTAEHVLVLFVASFAVSITVWAPNSLQLKVLGNTVSEVMPQLSDDPLLIEDANKMPIPLASTDRLTAGRQIATGFTLSMRGVAEVEAEQPLIFVTVTV